MARMPRFPRFTDGTLILKCTDKARQVRLKSKINPTEKCQPLNEVREQALKEVKRRNGDVTNEVDVLGEYLVQFGAYRGQTFRWMLENTFGYVVWFIYDLRKEKPSGSPLSQNKFAFKKYAESFQEVRQEVASRKAREEKVQTDKNTSTNVNTSKEASEKAAKPTVSSSAASLMSGRMTKEKFIASRIKKPATKFKPNIPTTQPRPDKHRATATCTQSEPVSADDDQELCALADELEKNLVPQHRPEPEQISPQHIPEPVSLQVTHAQNRPEQIPPQHILEPASLQEYPLPDGWRNTLPKADHVWVSQALFKNSVRNGKAELDLRRVDRLWWNPPQPALISTQPPRPDRYFAQSLLLWMPRKLFKVRLFCPHPTCDKKELTSAGIYHKIRQVLDIDRHYNLAAEYLECKSCKRKVISWSQCIVKQLDFGLQLEFPVLLSYHYACDVRVIRMLRQRGLGNSSTQLQKKLTEQHSEKWIQRTTRYLSDCHHFSKASRSGLVTRMEFEEPPTFIPVPKYQWLLTIYGKDVMSRIHYVKSSITSTFGKILKMDSTKKIVKKLAGPYKSTAVWATNVGNEHGQVLTSVLTASEGVGLGPMAAGLMKRYHDAGVSPPVVLYVDRDCCGAEKAKNLFSIWDDLVVRLDIWHFMRRIAAGCNTESHPLYGIFLSRLSKCIFEWSTDDHQLLKMAKRNQLLDEGIRDPSEAQIISRISRAELALHCRKKTCGVEKTTQLIDALLEAFIGEQGEDTLSVPLLDIDRTLEIWDSQKHHVPCLQDPEGVQLYVQTGTLMKGGIQLPTYRCARGSTSLESFHLHINRFVPGTSASDNHFQAYLLEGLSRWNADRAAAAVSGVSSGPQSYSGLQSEALNDLSQKVFGKKLCPDTKPRGIYTGELIGVEYLYSQTNRVLKEDLTEDDEDTEMTAEDEDDQLDEGFVENEDETVGLVEEVFRVEDVCSKDSNTTEAPSEGMPEEADEAEEAVGPDNIGGYGKVQALASYLVSLRDELAVTNTKANEIIRLWNNMEDYDKKRTKFASRHRTKLDKGRFKATKRRSNLVSPGVESTKRCFLGSNSGPAQWPDCNRYVEAVMIRLCELHPGPERSRGKTTGRWSLVCKAYKRIREIILGSAIVMRETNIQMVEINHATLTQWYNRRQKKNEQEVLKQGITLPVPKLTSDVPLPAAIPLPPSLPTINFQFPFQFHFPENTTGMANLRQPSYVPPPPPAKTRLPIQPRPMSTQVTSSTTVQLGQSGLSETNSVHKESSYLKRKRQQEASGVTFRKYVRTNKPTVCGQCKQPRDPESHKQYFGNWYCAAIQTVTFEQWRDELKKTKEYGKKKKD